VVRHREDTVIGSLWAVGMAAGILFIYKTPDYNEDLMIYLLESILMVSPQDLWMIAGLDILVVIVAYSSTTSSSPYVSMKNSPDSGMFMSNFITCYSSA